MQRREEEIGLFFRAFEACDQFAFHRLEMHAGGELAQLLGLAFETFGAVEQEALAGFGAGLQFLDHRRVHRAAGGEFLDFACEAREFHGLGEAAGEIGPDEEAFELGAGLAEFRQAHFAGESFHQGHLDDLLAVDGTDDALGLHPHLERVPVAGVIVLGGEVLNHGPGENIRTVETCQAQASAGGIETVVAVFVVGGEGESGRAGFVVELHGDLDFAGQLGHLALADAQGAAAEAFARAFDLDAAGFLRPARAELRHPLGGIERADGEPAAGGDGVGLAEDLLEGIDGHGETEVGGDRGLEREDAVDTAFHIEQRAAAVARLDGDGDLDHLNHVEITAGRDDTLHDAVIEAVGIADGNHRGAGAQRVGIAERQRGELVGFDADDRQVELAVPRIDLGDVVDFPIQQLHGHRTRLADHMQARGDQAIGGNHKARAHAVRFSVASEVRDDDDGFAGLGGEFDDGLGGGGGGLFGFGGGFRFRCRLGACGRGGGGWRGRGSWLFSGGQGWGKRGQQSQCETTCGENAAEAATKPVPCGRG